MTTTWTRLLFAVAISAFLGGATAGAGPAPPHVLLILADDLGWGDLSCYGNRAVETPHLDRLASEGLRLTQFYVAAPICSASRCGLITGQFPGCWRINSFLQTRAGNQFCGQADFLDPAAPTLPRTFKTTGYATAHVGKWHLGGGRDVTDAPRFAAYGYDLGLGTYESPEPAAPLGRATTPWEARLEPGQVPRHDRTRWMVDQVLGFFDANRGKACFVNLWLDDVHTPFRPSADQRAAIAAGARDASPAWSAYAAVLSETDRQIGRLLAGLRERELDGRTLVLFAGDNGPEPSFDRARTGGLRGMKWSLYEGGIKVPLIARWPGVVPAGAEDATSVLAAVDLFPTLCSLCGVVPPAHTSFDGEDLSAVLRGKKTTRTKPLFWEYGRRPPPVDARGLSPFPYPKEPGARSPNLALREGAWKLLLNDDGTGAELYNLAEDSHETHNRAMEQPGLAAGLTQRLLSWRRSLP